MADPLLDPIGLKEVCHYLNWQKFVGHLASTRIDKYVRHFRVSRPNQTGPLQNRLHKLLRLPKTAS